MTLWISTCVAGCIVLMPLWMRRALYAPSFPKVSCVTVLSIRSFDGSGLNFKVREGIVCMHFSWGYLMNSSWLVIVNIVGMVWFQICA